MTSLINRISPAENHPSARPSGISAEAQSTRLNIQSASEKIGFEKTVENWIGKRFPVRKSFGGVEKWRNDPPIQNFFKIFSEPESFGGVHKNFHSPTRAHQSSLGGKFWTKDPGQSAPRTNRLKANAALLLC